MFFSELSSQDICVIAFSGGADSRYLLEKIQAKCETGNFEKKNVIIAHFNHHLREDSGSEEISEATRDERFSREISERLGFVFELGHWNQIEEGRSDTKIKISENSAREARYSFLQKICQKYSAKYLITAHHKDDQAETVFLQFLRGGGVNSLAGMRKIRNFSGDCFLYRPLLEISKSEILPFLSILN